MSLFSELGPKEKEHKGLIKSFAVDVIKWEPESDKEASIIAHRYEYEDFPNGSYLIVGQSQMAIFTNNLTAGTAADAEKGKSEICVFNGPCKIKLETGDSRFAPFRTISHTLTGGDSAFHSTVYFINTTYMNELPWGTQERFIAVDPEEEVNVHVGARGMFGVHIEQMDEAIAEVQARKFLQKIVGTRADYTREELHNFMRAKILEYVPDLLAKSIIEKGISVLKISAYLSEFSEIVKDKLEKHFDDFGFTLDNFSFININVPDEDLRALNESKIKRKSAKIEAEGTAMQMDIESAARARMREREGYTYQQEESFKTMQAAASNEGTSSALMGAGMGLGMGFGVGGAFGAGMGNIAQNTLGNVNMNSAMTDASPQAASEGQVSCRKCGTQNPTIAKFCISCGEKMTAEEKCPVCGEPIVPGAKFCLSCGASLKKVCPNCGVALENKAKFCLECGTKISEGE